MVPHPTPFSIAIDSASGWRSIKVPGRNTAVGETFVPVAPGGLYRTPQATAAVSLRIRAGGNAADSPSGAGARRIELYGLKADGTEVIEVLDTAGTEQSAATENQFIRLFQAKVVLSGTYATQTAGSHVGNILIEDTAGQLWTSIPLNGFPEGITRIGAFTVPVNYEAYLIGFRINTTAQKVVDGLVFQRSGVLETSPPYSAMTAILELFNVTGFVDESFDAPVYLPPLTDVGVMAVVSGQAARVNSDLGLLLRRIR